METSALRELLRERLQTFAWNQWAQIGIAASARRQDRWAADPEALLLFTFEIGRDEPRLFDAVLDWSETNERLLSVQRLRNLARDDDDRALVNAWLGWVGRLRKRPRLKPRGTDGGAREPQPFFRTLAAPVLDPDPDFQAAGFWKQKTEPRHMAQPPDLRNPINFAFRLRSLLGIGVRAEVARLLVCSSPSGFSVQEIASTTGFAKRNTQEALNALRGAGVLEVGSAANEQRFSAPAERWTAFLGMQPFDLPSFVNWVDVFATYRILLRWLAGDEADQLSDYMRASQARSLMPSIEVGLRAAGAEPAGRGPDGAEYWDYFTELVLDAANAFA